MRTWLVALCALAATALSVGLPASPAGALDTAIVTITGSPNPGTTGSIIYDVTVAGTGTAPTGTVSVDDGQGGTCSISALSDNGDGTSSGNCSIVENAADSPYTVTATYNGDSNYASGATDSVVETVNLGAATVAITGNPNPGPTGSITYDVTVTGAGATPTGSVDVNDGQGGTCSIPSLSAGAGNCSIVENASDSPYTVTATYNGDSNYAVGATHTVSENVGLGTPTVTITGNPNPAGTGTVSYDVTVTGSGATPTGSVTVTDGQGGTCSVASLSAGSGNCSIAENAADSPYTVTATYNGDGNYASGATNTVVETVNLGTATVAITGNPNPGPTGSITYDVTVTGGGAAPTGSVTVADGQGGTCSITSLSAGAGNCAIVENASDSPYTVTATYNGDRNYAAGASQSVNEVISTGAPTVTITGNPNPAETGSSVSYHVTVTGTGPTPTGTVTVADGQGVTCPISLSTGAGSCSIVENAADSPYTVTATYNGDSNYAGGETNSVLETVNPAVPTVVIAGSPNPATTGSVTYHVTVTGGGATPTGGVTVNDGQGGSCSIQSLNAGVGSCPIAEKAADSPFTVLATYNGDGNYSSNTNSVQEVVHRATPGPPTISNIPTGAIYGTSFVATFSTISDGTPSASSITPSVCTASGAAVTLVGVGTCSLMSQTGPTANYAASSAGSPQSFSVGPATPSSPVVINIPTEATEFGTFVASVLTSGDGATSVTSLSTAVCSVGADGKTVTFVGFGDCTLVANVAQGAHFFGATGEPQSFPVGPAARGYWLVGSDGGIFSFGAAGFYGSMGGTPLQRPVVGITPSASRTGYWLVASDGGIFSFGTSSFYGSIPAVGLHPAGSGLPNSLNAPIVGMVPSITGHGYFMVASDGGVFAFGDARFEGSCPGIGGCDGRAVAVMPDSTGKGYWLVTNVGAVYAFGDATFYGAPPAQSQSVVDAVATPDWRGYWLLYANGAVVPFGDAVGMGAPLGYVNGFNPATSIFPTADGKGYWVASGRGDVFAYGNAPYLGSEAAAGLNGEIIAAFGF